MSIKIYEELIQGCKVPGCDRPRRTRGWCAAHYNKWRVSGVIPTRPFTNEARFYRYVDKRDPDECWEWLSTIKRNGYGAFWIDGKTVGAHRVSYEMSNGPITAGLVVRHTCDNKRCVNPRHLVTGTPKDNARDAVERGLYPRGERQGRAKLTTDEVAQIRRLRSRGATQRALATKFGVSIAAVQWILNGRSWAGIGETS